MQWSKPAGHSSSCVNTRVDISNRWDACLKGIESRHMQLTQAQHDIQDCIRNASTQGSTQESSTCASQMWKHSQKGASRSVLQKSCSLSHPCRALAQPIPFQLMYTALQLAPLCAAHASLTEGWSSTRNANLLGLSLSLLNLQLKVCSGRAATCHSQGTPATKSRTLYREREGLEPLLSPDEEEPPELEDEELSESSLAGRLGGGDAARAACISRSFLWVHANILPEASMYSKAGCAQDGCVAGYQALDTTGKYCRDTCSQRWGKSESTAG